MKRLRYLTRKVLAFRGSSETARENYAPVINGCIL